MVKLNFKSFPVYTGVSKRTQREIDIREAFADLIYTSVNGIRSHALALKIYQSEGETEFTTEELMLIRRVVEAKCLLGVIDGLDDMLNKNLKTDKE